MPAPHSWARPTSSCGSPAVRGRPRRAMPVASAKPPRSQRKNVSRPIIRNATSARGREQSSSRRGRCRSPLPVAVAPLLLIGTVPQVWVCTLGEHGEELGVAQPQRVDLARRFELPRPRTRGSSRASSSACAPSTSRLRTRLLSIRDCSVSISAPHTCLRRLVRATAHEHREPCEQPLFVRREEVVRPADGRVAASAGGDPRRGRLSGPARGPAARGAARERRAGCARPRARARAEGCRAGRRARPIAARLARTPARSARARAVNSAGPSSLVERRHGPARARPAAGAAPCSSRAASARPPAEAARCRSQPAAAGARRCRSAAARAWRRASRRASPRARLPAVPARRAPSRPRRARAQGREAARARPTRRRRAASSATSAAACSASRVFPVPPGPVSVSSRTLSSRRRPTTSSSSRARPRNGVAGTGRFVWQSVFSGGNALVAELEQPLGRGQVLQPVLAEVAERPRRRRGHASPATAAPARRAPPPRSAPRGERRCRRSPRSVTTRLAGVESHAHADRALARARPAPRAPRRARPTRARTRRRTRRPACPPRRRRAARTRRAARAGARASSSA